MNPLIRLGALSSLVALLAACGTMRGHEEHHRERGPGYGPMSALPVTVAVQASASMPMLSSGYKKVEAPAGAGVYFINLRNGSVVSSPVKVQFGLTGMGVAPAGVEKVGTGHHHLLVNVAQLDTNAPLPADERHRHFGAGQTETTLELKPGTHTLQLLLGDQNHIPHHPPVLSERITIMVR